jgi:hypothetical protein
MRIIVYGSTLFLLMVFVLVVATEQTYAQWSTDPKINTLIRYYSNETIYYPANVSDGAGGAIIMWYGPASCIYVQRINAEGVIQWSDIGTIIPGTSQEIRPVIVSDDSGGAIITWSKMNGGYDNNDIYAQRVDASGAIRWTTSGAAICTAAGNQYHPVIASDHAGGAIITWDDYRNSTEPDIYAQRINASGSVLWTADGVAISTVTSWQTEPAIASDDSGGAIITWKDLRSGTGYPDIYAQHINALGAVLWTSGGTPICTETDEQSDQNIISDGFGGAIIAWQDWRNGANYDIYAQRISAEGSVLWATNGQAICATANFEYSPEIISDGSGGAIFTWWNYVSLAQSKDLYAQRINSTGSVQWASDGVPICTLTGWQDEQAIAKDDSGGAIITWTDYRSGTYSDIYAQRINASGVVQWADTGVAIGTASGSQHAPSIVRDGSGGAIISWVDQIRGVYASLIGGNGVLGSRPTVSVEVTNRQAPKEFELLQNYPNPFNPTTIINYQLPKNGYVTLKIYNVLGKEVATLVNEYKDAGYYKGSFDASRLSSGVYFYKLQVGNYVMTKKMLLAR